MAKTAALGNGPIAFFKDGVQIEVPLSAIYFDGDAVHTSRSDLSPAVPEFDNWIKFLASRGRLVAAAAPAVESAMTVTAVAPGSLGNNIQVTVAASASGDATKADVTVKETDIYKGLTLASLITQLGTATSPGARPGLLCAKPIPPGAVAPANGPATFDAAGPTWTLSGAGATAVMLEPQRAGTGFDTDVKVTVSEASVGGPGRFTLTVTWSKSLADVALTTPPAPLNTAFGYIVTFAAPSGSKPLQLGTVALAGGNEFVAATKAVGNILAAG